MVNSYIKRSLRRQKKAFGIMEQGFLWKQRVRMDAIRQCHHRGHSMHGFAN
jgi:hypothetical protein